MDNFLINNTFIVKPLIKVLAKKFVKEIAIILDEIPLRDYSEVDVLSESKGQRIFYGKWDHSLLVFDKNIPVAVIISYEREAENNEQYPQNTLYISELAVHHSYQKRGLAKQLLAFSLDYNKKHGFLYLPGIVNFSVQTNTADWNKHVIQLYKSFGFKKRATKPYENRTDIVMELA